MKTIFNKLKLAFYDDNDNRFVSFELIQQIKLGLYDRPVPPPKDKMIEFGTDTRDDYTGWNVSTQ